MWRNPTSAASSMAGSGEMRHKKTRLTAYVRTSNAYAHEASYLETRIPPSASPASDAICQRSEESAPAAASWSCGTTRGVMASKDGRCNESKVANSAATTYNTQSCGFGRSAFTSSVADDSIKASSV